MRFDAGELFDRATWPQNKYMREMSLHSYQTFLVFSRNLKKCGYSYDDIIFKYFDNLSTILDRDDLKPNEKQKTLATSIYQCSETGKHVAETGLESDW